MSALRNICFAKVLVVDFGAGNGPIQAADLGGRQVRQGTRVSGPAQKMYRQPLLYASYVPAGPGISISYGICVHFPVADAALRR
jgi:hypothetical protein